MTTVVHRELLKNKSKQKYWVSAILRRIANNKNFIGFVSGATGSSKSWSCLSMGEQLDPENFNADRVVLSAKGLMDLINSGKLKKGSVIVFDEMGISMSNRTWQSVTNKMINYLLQTFRHKNFILLCNSPYFDFIDKATRKLFHAEFETISINKKKRLAKLKPLFLQYNSKKQKFYYHKLKVRTKRGNIPITFWNVPAPSDELIKQYEAKKKQFTSELNIRIADELDTDSNKGKKNMLLTDNQSDIMMRLKDNNTETIAKDKGISERAIQKTVSYIKSKGYRLEPIYDTIIPTKIVKYQVLAPKGTEGGECSPDAAPT